MKKEIKNAIEEYQCSGCSNGGDTKCFKENNKGVGCGKHYAGTIILGIGKIFLGMPKGFNRFGTQENLSMTIYEKFEDSDWEFNKWNIPVWKHLSKDGHTFVRGIMPRRNEGFIHIFLEDCMNDVDCFEVSQEMVDAMD